MYPAPVANPAVARAIEAVKGTTPKGVKKPATAPPNLYQIIKQTYMGG